MGKVWDLFKAALGLAADASRDISREIKEIGTAYFKFLQTLAKWSIILALILLPLPIIGSLLHFSWMSGLYLAVIGLLMAIWLLAALPIVTLVQYSYEKVKSIKKAAQLIGGILFCILLLAIYFYLVPVWNYPAAIPLIFIICAILALGFMRFGIGINPKLDVGVVVMILCLVTISFYMPTSRSAANTFVGWLDSQFAGFITSPLHPAPQLPKRIDYDHISIDRIVFFDPLTAEARVWYYKPDDGSIELFDSPGYHPQYKVKLEPISPDIVIQVKSQFKVLAERMAQEEQRKKEEAERIARAPRVPNKLRPIFIEDIVFFDPLTAEPRVWYFKTDDGRFDLFDGPGYHPQYKEKLQPITPEIVTQIRKQLDADAKKMAEQAKKEQAARIAKQKGEKPIVVIQPQEAAGEVKKPVEKDLTVKKDDSIKPEQTEGDVKKKRDN